MGNQTMRGSADCSDPTCLQTAPFTLAPHLHGLKPSLGWIQLQRPDGPERGREVLRGS